MSNIVHESKCAVRVMQVQRKPSKSLSGIRRRPRKVKEMVVAWYHRCDWCNEWFKPTRGNQAFCSTSHRHAAFRERRRMELADLRRRVGEK